MLNKYNIFDGELSDLENNKMLICTINAYSYNMTHSDTNFSKTLENCDVLIPDGISIVWAKRLIEKINLKKIAGADLFYYNMNRLQRNEGGKVFFLGSSENTLKEIKERAEKEFPKIEVHTYSPPFKPLFNEEESKSMISAINEVKPDVLFVGMTAPKQEIWSYQHFNELNTGHICCIGAVFDFYAGTIKRAPKWIIKMGLEWFFRLVREPKRMWKRYLIGNMIFTFYIIKEYLKRKLTKQRPAVSNP